MHGLRDIFDFLLPDIEKRNREFIGYGFIDGARHANAAGLGQRFQPRRDIDAVAVEPRLLGENIALIDADTKA